jgi:hypothetical protein
VQTINLAAVYIFDTKFKCIYTHPEGKGDTVIIIDKSGSMGDLQDVMRLIVSAIKCMAPESRGLWDVPAAGGGTALVDTFDEILDKHIREGGLPADERLRVMVVTDGYDNSSKCKELRFEEEQGGDMVVSSRPIPPMPTTDDKDAFQAEWEYDGGKNGSWEDAWKLKVAEMVAARCSAVADHIAASGAELIVLGVGSEVKDFINACNKTNRFITTALLDRSASDADVAAVVSTSVRVSRSRHAQARVTKQDAKRDDGEGAITATTAQPVEPEELRTMADETKRTTTAKERAEHAKKDARKVHDGPPFVSVEQHRYMNHLATVCAKWHGVDADALRGVLRWFVQYAQAHTDAAVPIALVGGRLFPYPKNDEAHAKRPGAIFNTPNEDTKDTSWTGAISKLLQALTHNPEDLGLHFQVFRNMEPEPGEALETAMEENRVGPLFIEQESQESFRAITKDDGLPQLGARVLYYKHAKQRSSGFYTHVRLNPRAAQAARYYDCGTPPTELRVVYKGNSSADTYGGPCVSLADAAGESQPEAAAHEGSDSEEEESLATRSPPPAGKSATKPGKARTNDAYVASLKKGKYNAEKRSRELEQENAALLRDNKRMKAMIMASMGGA